MVSSLASAVLLTGYPSFLARRMAEQILAHEPNTQLYCVVRSKFLPWAQQTRLTLPASQRNRMVLLEGDAASMDMGLSGAEYREVIEKVDKILHFAQYRDVRADPQWAHHTNVQGALEALEMAYAAPRLTHLVCMSSIDVLACSGLARESDPPKSPPFRTFIQESLAHAERIYRRAAHRIPVTILRPSTMIGDSNTGEIDRLDGPYPLFMLLVSSGRDTIPLPLRADHLLHFVPVDFVIRSAHIIANSPWSPGKTFHLVDPAPLSARRVFELVARVAERRSSRGDVPSFVARALVRSPGVESFARSPRAFLDDFSPRARFDATNTEAILQGTGVSCPPFESYVEAIVRYVQGRLHEQREGGVHPMHDPLL
ncbi:MAG TPA: SDR family oxidoreductase [Polyangiaceae bacterium]|jgi:thioester reductase-like protein|nr:MAG: Linear gramicidin synthase subunit D [Deltaproteobacteria bacterium ADurb.Bin207]HNS96329.1 SDR family oxidoreductase [Polyangiaceae bacterium]HNZ22061.1 SDR family oxidoreductase [Polyangiaceae bacterium]HOD22183.1 SDR family oxidoreductase [Polyangiaceae bacterium]HOE47369.1 SDR family oxidoreductase [Polyangiaceae bacterium]